MSRFHFNVDNSTGFLADEEGQELPDLDAARAEGLKGIRAIVAEEVLEGRIDLRGRMEIADEAGQPLLTIFYAEAVEIIRD